MRLLLVCSLLLLLSVPASATSGEWLPVTCPVCANTFEGWECHSTNSFGGSDRDFCGQAAGDQVFLLTCWTCPKCAYTGMQPDFDPEEMSEALVKKLKARNPLVPAVSLDAKAKRTDEIPAWVRWDLRAQVLAVSEEADDEDRAWASLRTAHTQRFGIERPKALDARIKGLWKTCVDRAPKESREGAYQETVGVAHALEFDALDPKLPLTPSERRVRLLYAAECFLRRGESPDAARVLADLRRKEPKLPEVALTMAAHLEERIARERTYCLRALPLFEELTKDEERDETEQLSLRYLVGELYRKCGQHKTALAWLEPLLEKKGPAGLLTWVKEAVEKTKKAAASD